MIKKLQSPMQTHFYETLHLIYNNVRDSGAIGEEAFMQARIRFQVYIILSNDISKKADSLGVGFFI
jgi:hypothetical protein